MGKDKRFVRLYKQSGWAANAEIWVDTVTGVSAWPLMRLLADRLQEKYRFARVRVHRIENRFFGGNVTVTGLLTGTDIISQCAGKMLSHTLLLPGTTLRAEQDLFLDDTSLAELSDRLAVTTRIVPQDGGTLCRMMLGAEE